MKMPRLVYGVKSLVAFMAFSCVALASLAFPSEWIALCWTTVLSALVLLGICFSIASDGLCRTYWMSATLVIVACMLLPDVDSVTATNHSKPITFILFDNIFTLVHAPREDKGGPVEHKIANPFGGPTINVITGQTVHGDSRREPFIAIGQVLSLIVIAHGFGVLAMFIAEARTSESLERQSVECDSPRLSDRGQGRDNGS
ncbi:hypothetical protein DTL42_17175 [Bremerella cremea]|uniref:Uncharacterized protein n=1 Tax=Bremerella cremea TaxID=1031537 RepID=A0A368KN81_9BACT|nr:hypothetical protein [Bremerella cremea]RCS44654.1 hypothetical protein DTL42_17175 [Bremerella cremea]